MVLTESLEMYLEVINDLQAANSKIRVTDIANSLKVSKPSVHSALRELEKRGYLIHESYRDVMLTEMGKEKSAEIRARHDLIKKFLKVVLNLSEEIAERDACRMEHILSPETLVKMREVCTSPQSTQTKN